MDVFKQFGQNIQIGGSLTFTNDADSKKWEKALEEAKTIYDFYFDNVFLDKNIKLPEVKKEVANILLPIIKKISNKIEQSHWIQKLSEKLTVKEKDIEEELKKVTITDTKTITIEEKNLVS